MLHGSRAMVFAFSAAMSIAAFATPAQAGKLYWSIVPPEDTSKIECANLDGSNKTVLTLAGATALAIDPGRHDFYYSGEKIRRGRVASCQIGSIEILVDPDNGAAYAMALDLVHDRLYVVLTGIQHTNPRINSYDLDGGNGQTVITGNDLHPVSDIAVDPAGGKIYWTGYLTGTLWRADLDGSDVEQLLAMPDTFLFGIAVDPVAGHVYFGQQGPGPIIRRTDLDGSNLTDLVSVSYSAFPRFVELHPDASQVYWFQNTGSFNTEGIYRANLDGSDAEYLVETNKGHAFTIDPTDQTPVPAHSRFGLFAIAILLAGSSSLLLIVRRRPKSTPSNP